MSDEVDGVRACGHVWKDALGQAADFVGGTVDPSGAVRAVAELTVRECGAGVGVEHGMGRGRRETTINWWVVGGGSKSGAQGSEWNGWWR